MIPPATLAYAHAAVDRGVARLDELLPEWRGYLVPARLDIASCTWCVLGQIRACLPIVQFADLLSTLDAELPTDADAYAIYGFDVPEPLPVDQHGNVRQDRVDALHAALRDRWLEHVVGRLAPLVTITS